MNFKLSALVFMSLLVSCNNVFDNNELEWVESVDNMVSSYNKEAQILETKTVVENGIETDLFIFNVNSDGVQKIVGDSKGEYLINFKMELYTKNNIIILERMNGLFPLIYKGKKKETDPCCEVFDKKTYFKSSTEVRTFVKNIKLISANEKYSKTEELEKLNFQEETPDQKYIVEIYNKTTEAVKEIKEKFK